MNFAMATRTPKGPGHKPGEPCTEFQLHCSQSPLTFVRGVFDYSEFRLLKYIEQVADEQQKFTLKNVLKDYRAGKVAIAWKAGRPVWIKVTKEKI
jgi:hypothetical protein